MIFTRKQKHISGYASLVKKYGEPQFGALEGDPCINGYGIVIFPNGEQFIREARTGEFLPRNRTIRYLGTQKGLHFYIDDTHPMKKSDQIKFASFPRIV